MAATKISQFPAISGSQVLASRDFIPIVRWSSTANTGSSFKIAIKEFFNSTNSLTEKTSGFANSQTFVVVTSGSSSKKLSLNNIILTSSYALTSSTARSSSYSLLADITTTATTSTFATHAATSSTATSSSYATRGRSSSYATKAVTTDTVTSSSYATRGRSASYAAKASSILTTVSSASYASNAKSASYASMIKSASYATNGGWANQSTTAITASYAANGVVGGSLTADTTVNFNSSMTTAQIQALIDIQPRMLSRYSLTFQFADGTYNLTAPLTFSNFNGDLRVFGNAANFSAGTSKNVYIAAASGLDAIRFYTCDSVLLQGIKIGVSGTNNSQRAVTCDGCLGGLYYNYFTRTDNSTSAGSGYLVLIRAGGNVTLDSNYFNSGQVAIYTYNGCVTVSLGNASSPGGSSIGTLCDAAITMRRGAGQPTATTPIVNQSGGQTFT